jgi:hypothetical protein
MALPITIDPTLPPDSETPQAGALRIRNLTQALVDLFGLPIAPTPITGALFSTSATGQITIAQNALGALLTNKTGVTLLAGNVVSYDATNDSAVALSDVQTSLVQFAVALATVAPNAQGPFVTQGIVTAVTVQGAVTRGHYLRKSATTLALEDTGTAMASATAAPSGAVAVALSGAAGPGAGSVAAVLLGETLGGTSGTSLAGARAYNSGAQTIAGSTSTALTFNNTRFNVSAVWAGGNPTRFTAPSDGVYLIGGGYVGGVTQNIWVRLGGATQISPYGSVDRGFSPNQASVNTVYRLTAGQYVEIMAVNASATPFSTIVAGNYSAEAYMQLLSS